MFIIQLFILLSSFLNMGFLFCVRVKTFFVEMETLHTVLCFLTGVVNFLKALREF